VNVVRFNIALAVLLALSLGIAGTAEAISCDDMGAEYGLEHSDAVFIGRAIGRSRDGEWHRFRVSRAWKGVTSRDVWITHRGYRDHPPAPFYADHIVYASNAELERGGPSIWTMNRDFPRQHVPDTGLFNSGVSRRAAQAGSGSRDRLYTTTCNDASWYFPDHLEYLDTVAELELPDAKPRPTLLGLILYLPDIVFYARWFLFGVPGLGPLLIGLVAVFAVYWFRR
jgi:hypothetical protein